MLGLRTKLNGTQRAQFRTLDAQLDRGALLPGEYQLKAQRIHDGTSTLEQTCLFKDLDQPEPMEVTLNFLRRQKRVTYTQVENVLGREYAQQLVSLQRYGIAKRHGKKNAYTYTLSRAA